MASLNKLLPEGGATVDQGDGFGHVSITVVSQHSALHPFMKHLHFSLETEQEVTGEHQKTPPPPRLSSTLPVQEVSQAVQAALGHSGAEAAADGGGLIQIHLHCLEQQTHT